MSRPDRERVVLELSRAPSTGLSRGELAILMLDVDDDVVTEAVEDLVQAGRIVTTDRNRDENLTGEDVWDLPVLAHGEITRMHRFSDPVGSPPARENAGSSVAFRHLDGVGTPNAGISRLNSPACAHPCQHFADTLADADA